MSFRFFLLLPIILLSAVQCCPTKNGFQKHTPFTIVDSFYQDWGGGQPDVSGTLVQLIVKKVKSDVQPTAIYYNNRIEKIDIKKSDNGVLWVANFSNTNKKIAKKDLNMYEDSKNEYGNTLPIELSSKKFDLQENEVVISYQYKGSIKYFKLKNLIKKETLFFPAAQPRR